MDCRVDLKAIMIEAEASKKDAPSVSSAGLRTMEAPTSSLGQYTNTGDRLGPRRGPVVATTPLPTQPVGPVLLPPRALPPKPQSVPTTPPRSTLFQPLGPKITPVRQVRPPSGSSEPRKPL